MTDIIYISLIFGLPLGALVLYPFTKELSGMWAVLSGVLEILLCAILIFNLQFEATTVSTPLMNIGEWQLLHVGFWLDSYSLLMLGMVALISALIRVYSWSYMSGDQRRPWFMVLLAFFTFAMYGIVLMPDLLSIFFFWEWVGLASYLLIGFWNTKSTANKAAKKAFLLNRIGDAGLFIACGILASGFHTLHIPQILEIFQNMQLESGIYAHESGLWQIDRVNLMWAGFGLLLAAMGKSAQFPLSIWLPDAMEGPTPASALIHAATMVTAGIYLLIRVFPLLEPEVLTVAQYIGGVTALWAGLAALQQQDLKKVLAYSTVSQIAFMLMAIGFSSPFAAFFHLLTHAFFKAALFLGAGIFIHQRQHKSHSDPNFDFQDLSQMQGLRRQFPQSYWAYLLASAALAGLPFSAGFLSKEAILSSEAAGIMALAFMLAISIITLLYTGRMFVMLFHRNKSIDINTQSLEPQLSMKLPYWILSAGALAFVFGWQPFDFTSTWVFSILKPANLASSHFSLLIASTLIILIGVLIVFLIQLKGKRDYFNHSSGISKVLQKAFYIDHALMFSGKSGIIMFSTWSAVIESFWFRLINILKNTWVILGIASSFFDRYIIDGLVNGLSTLIGYLGATIKKFQSGRLSTYLMLLIVFLLIGLLLIF